MREILHLVGNVHLYPKFTLWVFTLTHPLVGGESFPSGVNRDDYNDRSQFGGAGRLDNDSTVHCYEQYGPVHLRLWWTTRSALHRS